MLQVKVSSAILIFLLLFSSQNRAQSVVRDANSNSGHVTGQLICMLKSNADLSEVLNKVNARNDFDIRAAKRLSKSMNLWLLDFNPGNDEKLVQQQVNRQEGVQLVQFNHSNLSVRNTPNDTLFYRQWSFLNDGTNGGSGLADIRATQAWDITTGGQTTIGDTIVVAVIDQGFDVDHADLIDNMFINRGEIHGNNIDDDGNGYVDDRQGWDFYNDDPFHPNNNHGTHVAGTIGAKGNNQIGVTGVNWDVKILPITGSSTLESTVVEAYAYALELRRMYNQTNGEKGAYIVATNSSFGVDEGQPFDYPIWCAMYDSLGSVGILSAGATANDNINIDEVGDVPTACESNYLIAVTNMRSTDEINGNAGFGIQSIDLGAPGTGIYSTFSNDNYGNNTGTSMATPHVAGAIGLMYSAVCSDVLEEYDANHAGLALYMKDKLLDEGVDELTSMTGLVKTGGRLNLHKAIESLSDLCFQIFFDVDSSDCGACNGAIYVSTLGNSGAVSYSWSNGSTTDSIFDLCAGIYTVTATDGSDTIIESVSLSDSGGVDLTLITEDITCYDQHDGYIEVEGGFNYEWSDGSSNSQRSGLVSGAYFLTATDSLASCTTTAIVYLTQPDSLQALFQVQMPATEGGFDGKLTATAFGGTSPYSYDWSTSDTTKTITNEVGKYGITITDANDCQFIDSALLGYPLNVNEVNSPNDEIKIWPNPAGSFVRVQTHRTLSNISLIDPLGRIVLNKLYQSTKSVTLNTSNLDSGLYTVIVKNGQSEVRAKLIISSE